MGKVDIQGIREDDQGRRIAATIVIDTDANTLAVYDGWCLEKYQLVRVAEPKSDDEH
jgi:hypothetical protein